RRKARRPFRPLPDAAPTGQTSKESTMLPDGHPRTALRSRRRTRARILAVIAAVATAFAVGATANGASAQETDASGGCGSAPTLTSGTHTIQSGGTTRSFILKIPDGYDNGYAHRLIFGLHWWGGTANDVASGGGDGAVYAHYGL